MNWQPLNLAADEYARPTEAPVIAGLIYRGSRTGISAASESAKTLLSLAIGLEWDRAGFGRFAVIDFEQGAAATRLLLEDLGATDEELAAVYYVEADSPPSADDVRAVLAAGVTLVIIDAAAGAYDHPGSTTTNAPTSNSSPAAGSTRSGAKAAPRSFSTTSSRTPRTAAGTRSAANENSARSTST